MTDDETIALCATVIAGKRYDDDFTVIWRDLSISRIMQRKRRHREISHCRDRRNSSRACSVRRSAHRSDGDNPTYCRTWPFGRNETSRSAD